MSKIMSCSDRKHNAGLESYCFPPITTMEELLRYGEALFAKPSLKRSFFSYLTFMFARPLSILGIKS